MSKYTRKERGGQIICILCILLAIVIGLIWNAIEEDRKAVKPDAVYPITNANFSWEQTHHPGAWGGVNDGH